MANDSVNLSRNIKIVIIDNEKEVSGLTEDEKKDIRNKKYMFIRDSQYAQYRGLNIAMSYLASAFYSSNFDFKSEEFIRKQKELKNSSKIFDGITFGVGVDSKSAIINKVKKDFAIAIKNGLSRGERSITNYKRTFPLITRSRNLKFSYTDDKSEDIVIDWVNKIRFKCILGHNRGSVETRHILHKVINKEYKINESSLYFNNKKELILNLGIKVPKVKRELIEGVVLDVYLGEEICPVIAKLNRKDSSEKHIGNYEDICDFKAQFNSRRSRLQRRLTEIEGGKGRRNKFRSMETLKEKEYNFIRSYNHRMSKKIIDLAINNKCEVINLIITEENNVKGWNYNQLIEQIEYKSNVQEIKVKKN